MQRILSLTLALLLMAPLFGNQNYTIIPKDCLWNLAEQFYEDPFEWRRIWEANPYIANPHLIYPGDMLVIPGVGTYQVQDDGSVEPVALDTAVTLEDVDTVPVQEIPAETPRFAEETKALFNEPTLLRSPFVWADTNSNGFVEPGIATLKKARVGESREQYRQFKTAIAVLDKDGQCRVGDVFLLAEPVKYLEHTEDKRLLNIMKPVGAATVQEVTDSTVTVFINEAWDIIDAGTRVMAPRDLAVATGDSLFFEVRPSLTASQFTRIAETVTIHPNEVFLIDRGAADGVRKGDLFRGFEVTGRKNKVSETVGVVAMAVDVQEKTAALVVTKVFDTVRGGKMQLDRYGALKVK